MYSQILDGQVQGAGFISRRFLASMSTKHNIPFPLVSPGPRHLSELSGGLISITVAKAHQTTHTICG